MINKLLKLTLTLFIAPAIMQGQYANIWRMGRFCGLDFNSGTAQPFTFNSTIYINTCDAGICNNSGSLLFYTNGAAIFNSNNDTMQNGGNIYHTSFASNYTQYGMTIPQGDIIIPKPGSGTEYYLFHETIDMTTIFGPLDVKGILYYSIIDLVQAGGLGAVTNINNVFVGDTLVYGKLSTVKHANGRDWWIITRKLRSSQYCKWLITPTGIHGPYYQNAGSVSSSEDGVTQSVFSPDGSLYAQTFLSNANTQRKVELFNFDRCTGLMNVMASISFIDSSAVISGCSFSPNNRYLYVTTEFFLYQFDLLASNIAQSKITVGVYDGTMAPFYSTFYLHQIGPDGKIYICCGNGNWVIHVIDQPDSAGLACNFLQHQIDYNLNFSNIISLPNLPNYNLGALAGSPCDTLTGVSNVVNQESILKIAPNPNNGNFTLSYYGTHEVKNLEVFNTLGEKVYSQLLPQWSSLQNISIKDLPSGIYYCKIENSDGNFSVAKFVVEE